jgi:sulfur carrier protein ThiS
MTKTGEVNVTSFGQGTFKSRVAGGRTSVGEVLEEHGVEVEGRRIAVNGHHADASTTVLEGDQVSVVPRVQGG